MYVLQGGGRERRGREGREGGGGGDSHGSADRKSVRHRATGRSAKSSKAGSAGGMPVHCVVLPALLLGGVAMVFYFLEPWLLGSGVNKPLPLPPAVSREWRSDDVYLTRLWGTYRLA